MIPTPILLNSLNDMMASKQEDNLKVAWDKFRSKVSILLQQRENELLGYVQKFSSNLSEWSYVTTLKLNQIPTGSSTFANYKEEYFKRMDFLSHTINEIKATLNEKLNLGNLEKEFVVSINELISALKQKKTENQYIQMLQDEVTTINIQLLSQRKQISDLIFEYEKTASSISKKSAESIKRAERKWKNDRIEFLFEQFNSEISKTHNIWSVYNRFKPKFEQLVAERDSISRSVFSTPASYITTQFLQLFKTKLFTVYQGYYDQLKDYRSKIDENKENFEIETQAAFSNYKKQLVECCDDPDPVFTKMNETIMEKKPVGVIMYSRIHDSIYETTKSFTPIFEYLQVICEIMDELKKSISVINAENSGKIFDLHQVYTGEYKFLEKKLSKEISHLDKTLKNPVFVAEACHETLALIYKGVHDSFYESAKRTVTQLPFDVNKSLETFKEKLLYLLNFTPNSEAPENADFFNSQILLYKEKYFPPEPTNATDTQSSKGPHVVLNYGPTHIKAPPNREPLPPIQSEPQQQQLTEPEILDPTLNEKLTFPSHLTKKVITYLWNDYVQYYEEFSRSQISETELKIDKKLKDLQNEYNVVVSGYKIREGEVEDAYRNRLGKLHELKDLNARHASYLHLHLQNLSDEYTSTISNLQNRSLQFRTIYAPTILNRLNYYDVICNDENTEIRKPTQNIVKIIRVFKIDRLASEFKVVLESEIKFMQNELKVVSEKLFLGCDENQGRKSADGAKCNINQKCTRFVFLESDWSDSEKEAIKNHGKQLIAENEQKVVQIQSEIEGVAEQLRAEFSVLKEEILLLEDIEGILRSLRTTLRLEAGNCEILKNKFLESLKTIESCKNIHNSTERFKEFIKLLAKSRDIFSDLVHYLNIVESKYQDIWGIIGRNQQSNRESIWLRVLQHFETSKTNLKLRIQKFYDQKGTRKIKRVEEIPEKENQLLEKLLNEVSLIESGFQESVEQVTLGE
ncbi:hypothetical protein HK098_006162 [Nowakowskiella sp. JEL0407]|nr:hypothetical protein HK098_006162 [Nowakowskiella sp. JEL0407]